MARANALSTAAPRQGPRPPAHEKDAPRQPSAATSIGALMRRRSRCMDALLRDIWRDCFGRGVDAETRIALASVGGYGRRELAPHSDIDLVILLRGEQHERYREPIEAFIAAAWDLKLQVAHSVRSLDESVALARRDATVLTNLMDMRHLVGDARLCDELARAIEPDANMWPSEAFCDVKLEELRRSDIRCDHAHQNLEPNVKSSPGGLRYIQVLTWIAQRHFGTPDLGALIKRGLLTDTEWRQLRRGHNFLHRTRYALHIQEGRCQDNLRFDLQAAVAARLGYRARGRRTAAENFMRDCQRYIRYNRILSELLVQHFREEVLEACKPIKSYSIDHRFGLHNNHLEVRNPRTFKKRPESLLEVFALLARHEDIQGIRAHTIRLIRQNARRIDATFRSQPRHAALFCELFNSERGIRALRLMSDCGVLERWLPEFGRVVGLMQYDRFHTHTVDAHTIRVLDNMRRLLSEEGKREFPLAAEVTRRLPKPELLYIAGLYHDIAKGRHGDHSQLGARLVKTFCRRHGLGAADTALLVWLVREHLLMSMTAQRQDIAEASVIRRFAERVGDQRRLDYLYALTVTDIRATNPKLWTSWRAKLLDELYWRTRRLLARHTDAMPDDAERLDDIQHEALNILRERNIMPEQIQAFWKQLPPMYFLRTRVRDIVWHGAAIVRHGSSQQTMVALDEDDAALGNPATPICIYAPAHPRLFSTLAGALERLGVDIQDAHVFAAENHRALCEFSVLDRDGKPLQPSSARAHALVSNLRRQLDSKPAAIRSGIRYATARVYIEMRVADGGRRNILEVNAVDQPGLLAQLARALEKRQLYVQEARITTLGDRVDDVFYLTDMDGAAIADRDRCARIQNEIRDHLGIAATSNAAPADV